MENLLLSAQVVLPLFAMMALGYFLRGALSLDERWVRLTNNVVFRVLLPLLLFRNMYESDLSGILSPRTLGAAALCLIGVTATFLALYSIVPRLEKENPRRGVLIQGIFRGNAAIFGIPIATLLFGEGDIALIALLISCVVPLFNVYSIIALERFRDGRPQWRSMLRTIFTNPLIIAIASGMLCNALGIRIPSVLASAAWSLAGCATPVSFLTLGASFTFVSARQNRRALTAATLGRLVAVPMIFLTVAGLIGFRAQAMAGMLVIFGSPTAVSSYPMACAMGGDERLSSEIVVFTSAFSVLSMFLWIFALKSLGWL